MNTVTIRATAIEGVDAETGVGFPVGVRIQGGSFLSHDSAREIAQEAIGAQYGDYESGYLAVVDPSDWHTYQLSVSSEFNVKVVKY